MILTTDYSELITAALVAVGELLEHWILLAKPTTHVMRVQVFSGMTISIQRSLQVEGRLLLEHATSNCAMRRPRSEDLQLRRLEHISRRQAYMVVISKRAAVLVGAAYGVLMLFAVAPMYLFSIQQPQSAFMKIAGGLYTLTLLPAAISAVWSKRISGLWMILVAVIGAIALCTQEIARHQPSDGFFTLAASLVWWAVIAMIPAFIGLMILKSR
jgi:hypothetical protein